MLKSLKTTGPKKQSDSGAISPLNVANESSSKVKKEELNEDMELIGEIETEEDGLLNFTDFCRIYKLLRKYSHPSRYPHLEKLKSKRRDALSMKNLDEYRHLVQE